MYRLPGECIDPMYDKGKGDCHRVDGCLVRCNAVADQYPTAVVPLDPTALGLAAAVVGAAMLRGQQLPTGHATGVVAMHVVAALRSYKQKHGVDGVEAFGKQHRDDKRVSASHLCHNKCCLDPDHICLESQSYNMSRNCCPFKAPCPVCHTELDCCDHEPKCIKRHPATGLR
jgi:hypothetical protein